MINLPTAGVDYHVPSAAPASRATAPASRASPRSNSITQMKTVYVAVLRMSGTSGRARRGAGLGRRRLWFTDIKRRKVHRYDPAGGGGRSWDSPEPVGFVLPARGRRLRRRADERPPPFRSGRRPLRADRAGRAGAARQPAQRRRRRSGRAALVRNDGRWRDREDRRLLPLRARRRSRPGSTTSPITNGPALSPDGRMLYFVNTRAGTIKVADVAEDGRSARPGPSSGSTRPRAFPTARRSTRRAASGSASMPAGKPGAIRRPASASRRVRFPVANITKLAFGGDDLRTAYATTARHGI